MHACTYTSLLEMHKGNPYDCVYTIFQCRMRMIRILLSEKASQTLNSMLLKCVVCTDKLKLLVLSHVRLLHLCNLIAIYCTCSFLKYTFNMCLNFELFV